MFLLLNAEAWVLTMPHSNLEVLRKPVNTMWISSPRLCVETTMQILVFTREISQVSKLQDKHNASYFIMSCTNDMLLAYPNDAKVIPFLCLFLTSFFKRYHCPENVL